MKLEPASYRAWLETPLGQTVDANEKRLDESFDVVLAVTVLCACRNADAAIREAHRVLRPGGRLVVGELGRCGLLGPRSGVEVLVGHVETWQQQGYDGAPR